MHDKYDVVDYHGGKSKMQIHDQVRMARHYMHFEYASFSLTEKWRKRIHKIRTKKSDAFLIAETQPVLFHEQTFFEAEERELVQNMGKRHVHDMDRNNLRSEGTKLSRKISMPHGKTN